MERWFFPVAVLVAVVAWASAVGGAGSSNTAIPSASPTRAPTAVSTAAASAGMGMGTPSPFSFVRTNFCMTNTDLLRGRIPDLTQALKGQVVTAGVHQGTPAFALTFPTNMSAVPNGGLFYTVMREVARRGGFKVQYVLFPNCMTTLGTTTCLKVNLPHVDVYANNYFSDTPARRVAGIGFINELVDASVVLVVLQAPGRTAYSVWQFLEPFEWPVWLGLVGLILLNGVLHVWIEPNRATVATTTEGRSKANNTFSRFWDVLYHSFISFTQGGFLHPKSFAALTLFAGYTFFLTIIVSAYTAALTTSLITSAQTPSTLRSIYDANAQQANICGLVGTTAIQALQQYPYITAVPVQSNQPADLLAALTAGKCDGAVIAQIDLDSYSQLAASNPGCSLVLAGDPLVSIAGSWPYTIDFHNYCTSLMETTISAIIVSMRRDGTLQSMYNAAISATATTSCSVAPRSPVVNVTLPMKPLAGVFIIYAVSVGIALVHLLVEICTYTPRVEDNAEIETATVKGPFRQSSREILSK